jgi:hypothetical protein
LQIIAAGLTSLDQRNRSVPPDARTGTGNQDHPTRGKQSSAELVTGDVPAPGAPTPSPPNFLPPRLTQACPGRPIRT